MRSAIARSAPAPNWPKTRSAKPSPLAARSSARFWSSWSSKDAVLLRPHRMGGHCIVLSPVGVPRLNADGHSRCHHPLLSLTISIDLDQISKRFYVSNAPRQRRARPHVDRLVTDCQCTEGFRHWTKLDCFLENGRTLAFLVPCRTFSGCTIRSDTRPRTIRIATISRRDGFG